MTGVVEFAQGLLGAGKHRRLRLAQPEMMSVSFDDLWIHRRIDAGQNVSHRVVEPEPDDVLRTLVGRHR